MTKRSATRKLAYWAIFIGFFTLGPLLLLEIATRAYIHFKHGKPGKSYGLWQGDKELGAWHSFNGYNTNAETNDYGFRNVEAVKDPKPEGSLRSILYGGSIVFCYNLANEETWAAELERQLRKNRNPDDQVLNGGAISWSLGHLYRRAKRDLPQLKPDYVIIYAGINEQTNANHLKYIEGKDMKDLVEQGKFGEVAVKFDQARWIKRNLALVRLIEYRLKPFLEKVASDNREEMGKAVLAESDSAAVNRPPDPYLLANYLHVLRDFITLIQANGGKPVFVIQAHSGVHPFNGYLCSFSQKGAEVAKEMGALVLDANDMIKAYPGKPTDLYIESGVHYTKTGAEQMGQFLYREIFAPKPLDTTQVGALVPTVQ